MVVVIPAEVVVAGEVVSPEVARVGPPAAAASPARRGRVEEQLNVAVVHGVTVLAHCLVS